MFRDRFGSLKFGSRRGAATILVLASTYPRYKGDTEPSFVHQLSRRLVATDRSVVVVAPCAPGASAHELMDGVEVIRYRYAPRRFETLVNNGGIGTNLRQFPWKWLLVPTFLSAQLWVVLRLLLSRNIRAIHAHWLIPQGVIAAVATSIFRDTPFIVTAHGADVYSFRGRLFCDLKRWVAGRAHAVVAVSNAIRRTLEEIGIPPARIRIGPLGTDLIGLFNPDYAHRRSSNEIVFVGRLVEKKGMIHLINAMPHILSIEPSATLTVIGSGPLEAELRARVIDLNIGPKVRFHGALEQSELPYFYRNAAVFVAPFVRAESGDQDGFGLVVAEAMGCGCSVVLGDVAAMEEFSACKVGVKLVTSSDPIALASVVTATLLDSMSLTEEDRAAIRQYALRWDWTDVAATYSEVIDDAIYKMQQPLL